MQLFFSIILISFSHLNYAGIQQIGPLYVHVSAVFQMCSLEDSQFYFINLVCVPVQSILTILSCRNQSGRYRHSQTWK